MGTFNWVLLVSPTRRPSPTGCLLLHGVSSLNPWLVQMVMAMVVMEQGGTREKNSDNLTIVIFVSAGIGQLGLLRVEPPLVSEDFAYFLWLSFGLGHSQLLWSET